MAEQPIHEAAMAGDLPVVRQLIEGDRSLLSVPGGAARAVPLIQAAQWGHAHVVQYLLDQGADMGAKDKEGHTALTVASSRGRTAVVRLLLEKGAPADLKFKDGTTPLHTGEGGWGAVVACLAPWPVGDRCVRGTCERPGFSGATPPLCMHASPDLKAHASTLHLCIYLPVSRQRRGWGTRTSWPCSSTTGPSLTRRRRVARRRSGTRRRTAGRRLSWSC
jgi:hypothetical protein